MLVLNLVVLNWFCFRTRIFIEQHLATHHSTKIVHYTQLNFNAFMLSAANNSLHKTHCGCQKPCTTYSCNLHHISIIA